MRGILVAVLLAAVLAPVANAEPLPGFRESTRLEMKAQAYGVPASIYCSRTAAIWRDFITPKIPAARSWLSVQGWRPNDTQDVYLRSDTCANIEGWMRGRPIQPERFGGSLAVFLHELQHVIGVIDENEATCSALQDLPGVARKLFGVRKTKTLRDVAFGAKAGWPLEYHGAC